MRKTKFLLDLKISHRGEYYCVLILTFITAKLTTGVALCTALTEFRPDFIKEAYELAIAFTICLFLWIPGAIYFAKRLSAFDSVLPYMLISNLICISAFFILIIYTLKTHSGNYLLMMSPLIVNFILNIGLSKAFKWNDGLYIWQESSVNVNMLLEIISISVFFILNGNAPAIFNIESLLVFLIIV